MNYDLRTSTDFGTTYFIVDSETDTKKLLNKCKHINDRRWVITDEHNKPLYWCSYIEAAVRVPAGSAIASDDPYVTVIARDQGIKVFTSIEIAALATGKSVEELQAQWKKATPTQMKQAMTDLKKKVESGEIGVAPSSGVKEGEVYGKV